MLLFRLTITDGTVIWSRCQSSVILSTIFTKYPGFSWSGMPGQSSPLTGQFWTPVLPPPPPVLLLVLSPPYHVHHPPVYHGLHRALVPAHRADHLKTKYKKTKSFLAKNRGTHKTVYAKYDDFMINNSSMNIVLNNCA